MRRSMLVTRSRPGRGLADAFDVLDVVAVQVLNDALRSILAVQQLIEAQLQAFLAFVIDGGEADDMSRDLSGRVVAPVLAQQIHPGDSQRLDVRRLLGRHVPHQVQKLAIQIAGDAPRQPLLILLQRLGQSRQLIDVVVEFLRVDPDTVDRRADGQRFAVTIRDRTPMRGNLHHAHRTIVALLGQKAVIEQLQLDGAGHQSGRADQHQPQDHGRTPAVAPGVAVVVAGAQFHGRTIRTSRVCGRFICSLALATRSTKAFDDQ